MEMLQFVVVALGKEEYGLDVQRVREIIKFDKVTHIPDVDEYIAGVINVRGKLIVVLDIAKKMSIDLADTQEKFVVISEMNDRLIGFIIDKATEVLNVESDKISQPPRAVVKKSEVKQVAILSESRIVMLLDIDSILSDKEQEAIEAIEKTA
ncbi:MAG: chemotaxis protein CheW [Candidatus Woesearchaeota archaeon]